MITIGLFDGEMSLLLNALGCLETALVAQYERTLPEHTAERASIENRLERTRHLAMELTHRKLQ